MTRHTDIITSTTRTPPDAVGATKHGSPPSAARHRRCRRRAIGIIGAAGVAAVPMIAGGTAHAGIDLGADWAAATPAVVECIEGQLHPCPSGAGVGWSNRIHVRQELVDGEWRYATATGTSNDPDDVWLNYVWEGDCNAGYHVIDGLVHDATEYRETDMEHGWWNRFKLDASHVDAWIDGIPDRVNSYGTPTTAHFPVDVVLYNIGFTDGDKPFNGVGHRLPGGADPIADVLATGEQLVADRMTAGMSEEEARSTTESFVLQLPLDATVACKGNVFGSEYFESDPAPQPVTVVFEGIDPEPGIGEEVVPPGGELTAPAQLSDVGLTVAPDPFDDCLVNAYVTFEANTPTTVEYRVVNDAGQRSRLFTIEIGRTLSGNAKHTIELAEATETSPDGTLVTPGAQGDLGSLVQEGSGDISDVLHVEVTAPHAATSNHDGYSLPPCVPDEPDGEAEFELPTQDFVGIEQGGEPERTGRTLATGETMVL